eukprot:gene3389-1742_t
MQNAEVGRIIMKIALDTGSAREPDTELRRSIDMTCIHWPSLALISKWVYVSKIRGTPYLRVPAFLVGQRNNGLRLGIPVYADTKREELFKPVQNFNSEQDRTLNLTLNRVQQLRNVAMNQPDSAEMTYRDRAGEILKNSAGKIFNVFIWDEICGESLDNLFNYPLFPYMPSRKRFSKSFKLPNYGKNYAVWLVGYMIPFCSGNFRIDLKIKSGNSEVWISDDQTREKLKQIIRTNAEGKKTKGELNLEKDRKYYFEVFHKQGHGTQNVEIVIKHQDASCRRNEQSVTFEPYIPTETIWGYKTPAVEFKPDLLKRMKEKATPTAAGTHSLRDEIFKIPFIDEADIAEILPKCTYKPSYIVQNHLNKIQTYIEKPLIIFRSFTRSVFQSDSKFKQGNSLFSLTQRNLAIPEWPPGDALEREDGGGHHRA